VRPSRSTFDAAFAAFADVFRAFATSSPLLPVTRLHLFRTAIRAASAMATQVPVLPTPGVRGFERKVARAALKRAAKTAGLTAPEPSLRDLRHSHAPAC